MTAAASVAKDLRHEEIFLERYNRLLTWAFQLTKPDRELARDVVQDAFIQFTGGSNDLIAVNNIDNYLFGVVRNTYLSHRRRSFRQQQEQLAELDLVLLSVDPRRQIHINDDLRAICHHACARKDTSITGSILILRFFHGYVPSEVARLINSSRNIVDVQLRFARAEAIASLEKPKVWMKPQSCHRFTKNKVETGSDFLTQLRELIFATRRGQCFDAQQLGKFYKSRKVMSRTTLSHLVSCQECLDKANRLLELPPLTDRNVIDVLGRTNDPETKVSYPLMRLLSLLSASPILAFIGSTATDFFEVMC